MRSKTLASASRAGIHVFLANARPMADHAACLKVLQTESRQNTEVNAAVNKDIQRKRIRLATKHQPHETPCDRSHDGVRLFSIHGILNAGAMR